MSEHNREALGPLRGVRVLDMSTSYAGPVASMFLADMGADVVKVERPHGDDTRAWGPPFVDGVSAWFASVNRNKRSISIDLRAAAGREILEMMLGEADVFLETLNPSKLAKLDLVPEDVVARHPQLVYCGLSGFGFTGPDRNLSGYDLIAQARSGLMSVTGERGGTPQRSSTALTDVASGMVAAFAIASALHEQQRSGLGCVVDVSLLDTALSLMAPRIASFLAGEPEPRPSGATDSVLAIYQTFVASDRPIVVAVGNDAIWSRFCAAIEQPELALDPRFATNEDRRRERETLIPSLHVAIAERPASHWLEVFSANGIPCAPIKFLSEVVEDEQIVARGGIVGIADGSRTFHVVAPPWRLSTAPPFTPSPPPALGADGLEILRELGLSVEECQRLVDDDVVRVPVDVRTNEVAS